MTAAILRARIADVVIRAYAQDGGLTPADEAMLRELVTQLALAEGWAA